jgi:hypothetical protein
MSKAAVLEETVSVSLINNPTYGNLLVATRGRLLLIQMVTLPLHPQH